LGRFVLFQWLVLIDIKNVKRSSIAA